MRRPRLPRPRLPRPRLPRPRLPRPRLPRPRLPRPRLRRSSVPRPSRRAAARARRGRRLQGLRERLDDAGFLISRAARRIAALPLAAGRAVRDFWFRRSLSFRRRAAAVILILGLYALVRLVPLPGVPCGLSPAEECPPTDDAIAFVPAEAYAYLHLNIDPGSGQLDRAEELAARFPHFAAIAQGSFRTLGPGRALDLGIDVRPWLGDEVAAAVVAGPGGAPAPVIVAAVDDSRGARAFLAKVGGTAPQRAEHSGVEVSTYSPQLASAETGGFLLLGEPPAVRAAIDTEAGEEDSLADSERARSVRAGLPDHRLADAYISEEGIAELLNGRAGVAGQLDTFTDYGASEGIAAALVARGDGLEVDLHSALDPAAAEASPGFFAAFPPFEPSLASELAPDTLAMLAIGDPSRTIPLLLDQARAAVPGVAEAFERLDAELAREGGVDLEEELLPALRGEAAVGVAPARPVPYVTAVFDDVDEAEAREAVAQLQAPLVAALDPAQTGQAPVFSSRRVDGVEVQSLRLGPALEPAYAVFDGRLVIATDPRGVEEAIAGEEDLAGSATYGEATGSPGEVSALVFLDLAGLVELAEPRGLAEIVSEFSEDLDRLRALSLTVRSSDDSLDTELFLKIEQPKETSP